VADTLTSKGLTILDPALFYDVAKFNNNFNLINNLLGTIICTSTTRPSSSLYDGMQLWETDTQRFVTQVSNAWVPQTGRIVVADHTARNAIVTKYDGMEVYRQDRDWVEIWDGAAWRVQGTAMCTSTTDRDNANVITSPYDGQMVLTKDNDTLWQYNGSVWACLASKGVIARGNRTTSSSVANVDGVDVAVLRVSGVTIYAGRLYRITTSPLGIDSSSTNDEGAARIRHTTNNTNAGTGSTILPGSNVQTRQTDANVAEQKSIHAYLPGVNGTLSVCLCVRRIAGAGNVVLFVNTSDGDTIDLIVEDVGIDPGDTGTDL